MINAAIQVQMFGDRGVDNNWEGLGRGQALVLGIQEWRACQLAAVP